jgi:cell division protein FtsI/penicillin-binding protein 2
VTVTAYLAAWQRQEWPSMAALVHQPPADFTSVHATAWSTLGVTGAQFRPGPVTTHGSTATLPLDTTLTLAGFGPLALHSTLALTKVGGKWLVAWTPQTIASQLGPGDTFNVSHTWPARAPILGAGGVSLTPSTSLVTVGVVGQRITDATSLAQQLVAAGLPQDGVSAAISRAQQYPTQFTPVVTIPEAEYLAIKAKIYPLPGTQFETTEGQAPLTPDLAAHVVGHVGSITAQQLKSLGAPYTASDTVGQNGLQEVYERQLAGTPATTVAIVDGAGHLVATLGSHAAQPGQPLQTTLDPRVQQAAEAALAGVSKPAAIVVEQASTGDVLASVSRPTSEGFDLALEGQLPPGSTFKVITTAALIAGGDTPATPATCPPTIDVEGKTFTNYEKETAATLTLEQAFAMSCNTAFIGLSTRLTASDFASTARSFGIGATYDLGLNSYSGQVGSPSTPVDLAATAIGQGQVLVSPLTMATVAAAVDSGALHLPRLVTSLPSSAATPVAAAATLRGLMAEVVTSPSGTAAGAGLPAGTFGKTGTAEFGSGPNPATHAWFIGFRGDLAFAVVVYGGGVGGQVAAPIAASLLRALGP